MDVSLFDYDLPEERIAQSPPKERGASRLMVLSRKTGDIRHAQFAQFGQFLQPGDVLVINDSKVIPARLIGQKKETGGVVEVLLIEPRHEADTWEVLIRPARRVRVGTRLFFGREAMLEGVVKERLEDGGAVMTFHYEGNWDKLLDRLGEMPLPPYIRETLNDPSRYQTVYATHAGSVAAPTAGLHFTESHLQTLIKQGIDVVRVTLHVGIGTFRPVKVDHVEAHTMHHERYTIPEETVARIDEAKAKHQRVIAVGTTSLRTLEGAYHQYGRLFAHQGKTDVFIYPGFKFHVVDALLTNFHLPRSTLLMLVSAFATREYILAAYQEAIQEGYRFFSFGDAMLII
ncbi:MAG: tRNA preQ1(34) S-adenosylmethionine ribosyltransferase-isomerase QueA [Candidatus Carbobacillus sp.]|nr:tRNA preQ1(34) S-adenosylmethionine ribosyltransferase-isomerase QueA [Candidatus Carbobacillus sp.]